MFVRALEQGVDITRVRQKRQWEKRMMSESVSGGSFVATCAGPPTRGRLNMRQLKPTEVRVAMLFPA